MAVWAFLSDVHGSRLALERAVALARDRGADRFGVLGDLLGRGEPDGVVELVRSVADVAVVGNRDVDWQDRVGAASRAYVQSLPREAEADGFLAVHGDSTLTPGLGSADLHRGLDSAYQRLEDRGRRLLVFGHTHQARVWCKDGIGLPLVPCAEERLTMDLLPGRVYILNVGSVGRPFPGKGPAAFALYDSGAGVIEQVILPRLDSPKRRTPPLPSTRSDSRES